MKKNSSNKTYKIDSKVLFNLEAVISVTLEDLGADSVLAKDDQYLQKKIAEKIDDALFLAGGLNPAAFKIKIINKKPVSFEIQETKEGLDDSD